MSKQAKAADMREKSENDLLNRERELIQQLFKLRFQKATGSSENPSRIRQVRREIARLKTVLGEKQRAGGEKKIETKPAAEKKAAAKPAAKRAPKKPSARRAEGQQS